MQMPMGVTKVIAEASRLGVPDVVGQHGGMTVSEMVSGHGIGADPDALERLLGACASVGLFTEDAAGKFGATELSGVLTADSPGSVKQLVESVGGLMYNGWAELAGAVRTGKPQSRKAFGLEFWDGSAIWPWRWRTNTPIRGRGAGYPDGHSRDAGARGRWASRIYCRRHVRIGPARRSLHHETHHSRLG
jgi:hypothetical protein